MDQQVDTNAEQKAPTEASSPNPPEFLIQFFKYDHLPPELQSVSKSFGELAEKILETLPRNPERTVALRKLLEAKDAAVRAKFAK
jgi:hypothetical protein